MTDPRVELAIRLFQDAYQMQMQGELDVAMDLYKKSIHLHPTAEAYTFLGWAYRFQGRLDDAILECKHAIELDPTFGNPYNDIGAYLIEKGQVDDAIPWLEGYQECTLRQLPLSLVQPRSRLRAKGSIPPCTGLLPAGGRYRTRLRNGEAGSRKSKTNDAVIQVGLKPT